MMKLSEQSLVGAELIKDAAASVPHSNSVTPRTRLGPPCWKARWRKISLSCARKLGQTVHGGNVQTDPLQLSLLLLMENTTKAKHQCEIPSGHFKFHKLF